MKPGDEFTMNGIRYRVLSEEVGPYVKANKGVIEGPRFTSVEPCP